MAAEPDFKGLLQSHCQKAKLGLPQYTCVQTSKRNRAFFIARVTVMGKEFSSEAEFSSKKQAEKNAAKVALFQLRILSTAKLNNYCSCGPANIASGPRPDTDNWYELNEGQVFSETSSVLGETPDKSHKEDFSAPVLPSEGEGTLKVAAPEDERPLLSAITSDLVPGKSNAPLSYKNILQEKAQKMGQSLPHYETTREADGFVCTVIFNGQSFKSDGCSPNKKMAQQNAASRAIQVLTGEQTQKETLLSGIQTVPTISPSAAIEVGNILSYKNLLQENCQQRGHRCPSYSTSWQGSGFVSVVQVGDKTVSSKAPYETKKRAEQMAAREALLLAGVHKPEDAYKNSQERKGKLKRNFDPEEEFNRTSLVHCHGGYGMGYPNLCRSEADYSWEKGIVSKRLKLDTSECHANFGGNNEARTINLPQDYRRDFTVAEIWKEKKNIVIIGHEETSFVLYCTIIPGTCNLFNNHTKSLILLQPGYRIIGLDAQYSHHNGKVTLQAERCADVIIPETPDPVLTSCGVVLLYEDPQSDSLQVLLKRYRSSQAFVNVAAALAQYFRRSVSGRHAWLDTESITEHIRDWMSEEVQSIANMNREALQQVFTCMWKFNERWCSVLNHPLPKDLELLKARAHDEFARRQASGSHHSEDYYHPWGLPKGNFKHRMLSTGLFIETPADCAVRELKEETGIKLDTDTIKNCSQVDLPHIDNLNPHKGDVVKYFLHVYSPEDKEDELTSSYELEQMHTSLEFETEQDIFSETPCRGFSPASEQEAEDRERNERELGYKADICVGLDKKAKGDNMEKSPANQTENCASRQNYHINEALKENRGVKRKHSDDDDEKIERTMHLEIKEPQESRSSERSKISSNIVYTPGCSKEMMANRRSPRVKGSGHEECAWFTIDEARRKSPAFQQIYQTQQFTNLLTLITKQL